MHCDIVCMYVEDSLQVKLLSVFFPETPMEILFRSLDNFLYFFYNLPMSSTFCMLSL